MYCQTLLYKSNLLSKTMKVDPLLSPIYICDFYDSVVVGKMIDIRTNVIFSNFVQHFSYNWVFSRVE